MRKVNLEKISKNLISLVKGREREVLERRFGLFGRERETLQAIGKDYSVCRERIRQIEEKALEKIKRKVKRRIFDLLFLEFKAKGGIRKEESLISEKGREIIFLLNLDERFQRRKQDEKFFALWNIGKKYFERAKEFLEKLIKFFEREKRVLSFKEISKIFKVKKEILASFLEISKSISKNEAGFYGLCFWPEIKPRGVRDKAYLVLKEIKKPLHFTEIAAKIEGAKVATVHNELIKDERFVLVGRGIYALREWGFYPGEVKDVILKILREKGRPMTRQEILEEIKKQRLVKPQTVFLALYNKEYFGRNSEGKYYPKIA